MNARNKKKLTMPRNRLSQLGSKPNKCENRQRRKLNSFVSKPKKRRKRFRGICKIKLSRSRNRWRMKQRKLPSR